MVNHRDFYSGKFTAGSVDAYLNRKFIKEGLATDDVMYCTHAADSDGVARTACLAHRHPQSELPTAFHVFGKFDDDRLSCKDELDALKPDLDNPNLPPDEVVAKWRQHGITMLENPSKHLSCDATSWCYRHGKACSVHQSVSDALHEASQDYKGDNRVAAAVAKRKAIHKKKEIMLVSGGTTCTDFAKYGSRSGEAGKSTEALNSFCLDLCRWNPVMFFVEIAGLKDLEYYRSRVGHKFEVNGLDIDSNGLGGGGRRVRMYAHGCHHFKGRFHGSAEAFIELFSCNPQLEAADYFVDSAEERFRIGKLRAQAQGNHLAEYDEETRSTIEIKYQLTALQLARLSEHKLDMLRKVSQKEVTMADKPLRSYVADIEQNTDFTMSGSVVPPLVTHGVLVDLLSDELMTPMEMALVQGESVCLEADAFGDSACCLSGFFKQLNKREEGHTCLKRLVGNSQTMFVIGLWVLYCLSETEVS